MTSRAVSKATESARYGNSAAVLITAVCVTCVGEVVGCGVVVCCGVVDAEKKWNPGVGVATRFCVNPAFHVSRAFLSYARFPLHSMVQVPSIVPGTSTYR